MDRAERLSVARHEIANRPWDGEDPLAVRYGGEQMIDQALGEGLSSAARDS